MPEPGARGAIFGRSVNAIPTRKADSAQPLLLAPPNFFTFRHPWSDVRVGGGDSIFADKNKLSNPFPSKLQDYHL